MVVLSGGSNFLVFSLMRLWLLLLLLISALILTWLCGLVVIEFSSYLLYTLNSIFTSLRPQEYGVVLGFLAIGFICILGFFGCCGAWKKNVCMLTAVCCKEFSNYSTILPIFAIVVAILRLAAIVVACYLRSSI
ncbi:unnamed protein product [Taenia asiatica]|uniref:Ovule protein n=1 Tax=Taenia asiatica TaxID=60517 RepID=A0A0R3VY35_TAEAS|nr:unnamed protein product [Taenia asiatica]